MASGAGQRKRKVSDAPRSESSPPSSSSSSAMQWDSPYVRHSTSSRPTGVLTIDVHRFGVQNPGLVVQPIPFDLDSVDDVQLPAQLHRKAPPAALAEAVTAVNRFVQSPAFARLLQQVAHRVAAAEAAEQGTDPRVADWDETKTGAQVRTELVALVKKLDISVVPWPTTHAMHSILNSNVIKMNQWLLTRLHRDAAIATPSHPGLHALLVAKLIHQVFHHFLPVLKRYLYQTIQPPADPPHLNTAVKIQGRLAGGQVTGEIGELAERLLCGGVLSLDNDSFLDAATIRISAGVGPTHPYSLYDLHDAAVLRLQPECFTAICPNLEVFAFGIDATLRQVSASSPSRSSSRRAALSPSLGGHGDEGGAVDVEGDEGAAISIPASFELRRDLVPSRKTPEELAEFWARNSGPDKEWG